MNTRSCFSYVIYLFAGIGLISVFLYAYYNHNELLPLVINIIQKQPNYPSIFPPTNMLFEYIEECPECFLFLLENKTSPEGQSMFEVLNNIRMESQAMFYPLTMKLFYNQPIPYYTILANNQTEMTMIIRQTWIDSIANWSNPKENSMLNLILQSLEKPLNRPVYSWPNQTKLILYYTKFFGNDYWYNSNAREVYSNDFHPHHCPLSVNACHITIDPKRFSESDASLIHLRESIDYHRLNSLPRQSHQRLVFFLKESPVHSPTLSVKQHGHLFNYTQTYRPDSDVTGTTLRDLFWLFNEKIHPNMDLKSILQTKEPEKILVAIISNCGGSSNRLEYIKELRQHIPVDVFGKCGKTCPISSDCRQYVYSKYKFYLSFENSLCDEYVTEKFFYALNSARIIPVVLGWARYDHYIPTSAYIDVRNFTSPKTLAEYLHYLDGNNTAYLEYFQWRQYALHIKLPKYMCELCLKLFLDDRDGKQQSLEQIDQYWNKDKQCHSYRRDDNGTWIMK